MTSNPVSRVRTWGSVAIIGVTFLAIAVLSLTDAAAAPWVSAIVITALGFALASYLVNRRYPDASDQAWDEMNQIAHRDSLAFGYWAALAVFVALFAAVYLADLDPAVAFFWMGPVLGLAPAIHFLSSVARGRAE
ncbi:hypothetical protein [Gymnodinialimonas sp.]